MTLRDISWQDPALSIVGAQDLRATKGGISPVRLPAWTQAQMPDPALEMMARMTSGVRIVFRTDSPVIELDLMEMGLQSVGSPRRPATLDLRVNGVLQDRQHVTAGGTVMLDPATRPPRAWIEPGEASTLRFDSLPAGSNEIEIWLPQSASTELRALRLAEGASLERVVSTRRRWAHYGSSISHGMEASGPSETWPAVAALRSGVDLIPLGFAGQCQLDSLVARTLRDSDADLISLKLGINVINVDAMRERVFVPAVHGFLDTIRDRKPDTPILVVSPIICPVAEAHPGPTLAGEVEVRIVERPADLHPGALSLQRVRHLLSGIVERRRAGGDRNLHYLDGLDLFGEADVQDLPDGLHPNAAGLVRLGERFAQRAFGAEGPFAA